VIERITENECAGAQLKETPMLIGMWSPGDTTWVEYPGPGRSQLQPTTAVQIGSLTTSYLVPQLLAELEDAGLSLESVAIPVVDDEGQTIREITYRQLLLHHSDLPSYAAKADESELDQLLGMNRALVNQDPASIKHRYKFDHWNYVLASTALRSTSAMRNDLRPNELAFTDKLSDSLRQALLTTTTARALVPQERTASTLFAASTAGVASAMQLISLLDSLSNESFDQLVTAPTHADRPNTLVAPGWHIIKLKNGEQTFINSGKTRFFGSAVVYYPLTKTGVVIVAADSKRLDCLAMDILRNLNNNWRRVPSDE